MSDIWDVLGIEPTTDKRRIKKAYAEAVKSCHPEEHPEEFKQLYEAYQTALNSLAAKNKELSDAPVRTRQPEMSQGTIQEEVSETARPGIQMIFDRNDQQKRDAWEQLKTLWDTYLENRNLQNAEALILFMKGTKFPCIRDLDDTVRITMLMMEYMITENRAKADDKVLRALCDIYGADDAVSDEFDLAHLEDSAQRELSAMLRNEQGRRVRLRQQRRKRVGSLLFNLVLFGGVAIFLITVITQILDNTKHTKIKDQCKSEVAHMLEQEYPQLRFGDVLGEWEITDGDTENTYIITTEVRTKSGMLQKGSIRVEAERGQEGNIIITSEKFTGIEIK